MLNGIVLRNCHRIYSLCSDRSDIAQHLRRFYHRLIACGYKPNILLPKFAHAKTLAAKPPSPKPSTTVMNLSRIFLHLEYHPYSPPPSKLQELWKRLVFNPPYEKPLTSVVNNSGTKIGIEKMIIAYSRPRNLGNLLSYRNLHTSKGPPVSSLLPSGL